MISKIDKTTCDYVLVTDSGSDLPKAYLKAEGIKCVPLSFYFEGEEKVMTNDEMGSCEFYEKMRNGEVAKTSAPNPDAFENTFREILDNGQNILYLGFDSSLSTTFNSGRLAAQTLSDEYPDRTIMVFDTLCASAGQGLLVAMTKNKMNEGYSLKEAYEYAIDLAPRISHRFTVETLSYLCRGGRISKTAAMAGNILNIKPVLHMDDAGNLINLSKARGRNKSLSMLVDAYEETAVSLKKEVPIAVGAEGIEITGENDNDEGMIMISHADCREDADRLTEMIKERTGRSVDMICDIGPVIGSHAGPGTIALFFVASAR